MNGSDNTSYSFKKMKLTLKNEKMLKIDNIGWELALYKVETLYAKVIMLHFSRAFMHCVDNKLERRGDTHPLRA